MRYRTNVGHPKSSGVGQKKRRLVMPNDPYTIRIYVPDGDPDGIKIVSKGHWTGSGIIFPREKWKEASERPEFGGAGAGVYILVGRNDELDEDDPTNDIPTLYIGEGDGIRDRIGQHFGKKSFWTWGVAFVSSGTHCALNKAQVQWLEYALVKRAKEVSQCRIENGNTPQEPALTESDRADTRAFLGQILQILPLVNLRAFETPKVIVAQKAAPVQASSVVFTHSPTDCDTVVVPCRVSSFQETFVGENCWYAIRIRDDRLDKLQWIAAYQKTPEQAITHVARIHHIEPYGDEKKYKLVFSDPAKAIGRIRLGDAKSGIPGPRYTCYSKLIKATQLTDLWENA
jgi:hypothetical protein